MKLIIENPYRRLGILVGTTLREQTRQINKLKMFIEAEQEIDFDEFSFPTLGKLKRNLDTIVFSENQLNLDRDKLEAAIFWFYDGYTTDIPAFDCIKENNLEGALTIWQDLIAKSDMITNRSASAYNNLGTLFLSEALDGGNTNGTILEQGIFLKIKFLESEYINDFIILATAENYKATKKEIQLLFLNQLLFEIEKSGIISLNTLLDVLIKLDFLAKQDFLNDFVQKSIEFITRKIEDSKSMRKTNKSNSIKAANKLLSDTKDSIKHLKSILGTLNINYSSISDKLAMEFFACGSDYFRHFKDSDKDPGEYSMTLFKNAKRFVIGSISKQQIDENIRYLQVWIDEKPERDKQKEIQRVIKFITDILQNSNKYNSIANARNIINECKPKLENLKTIVGVKDDFYLKISSAVVNNILSIIISVVNNAQEEYKKYLLDPSIAIRQWSNHFKDESFFQRSAPEIITQEKLSEILIKAYELISNINSMDMLSDTKEAFSKNKSILNDLKNEYSGQTTSKGNENDNGCYIATMAYGDYYHPQVLKLRKFRDEVLNKSTFGRSFVKTYYHYSPKLVEKLKNQRTVNVLIRKALDQFIKLIK